MVPVAAVELGGWALRNWKALAVGGVIVGVAAWGGWNAYWRADAEKALATQRLKIEQDNNAAWAERERKRQEFEQEVRDGLARLTKQVETARDTNAAFKRQVQSNADSNVPLSPADLDDLRMLKNGRVDSAGGSPVRPAR